MSFSDREYFRNFEKISWSYLSKNYDYYYLKAMHEKNRLDGADTIIVGSSHALFGINEHDLTYAGKTIQFSIASQDLYYDFLHIKKAFSDGKKQIKNCFINFGYYMLYQDVSRAELVKYLVPNVYMNLFGEEGKHNYVDAVARDPLSVVEYNKDLYPPDIIRSWCEFWSNRTVMEEGTFFNNINSRANHNMLGVRKVIWNTLSEEEKYDVAKDRTLNGHNKHVKYEESHIENIKIIQEMVSFLYTNGVKPLFFITPYTKYYNQYIYSGYKPDIYKVLDELDYPVEFFDMNDFQDEFTDEDFLDSDHLNDIGAKKATVLLDSYLENVYFG
ncbi:hypothetical protein NXH67_08670 [Butyrivibrio sp. DSM 10294]|uniref:hypothetical protein n=1 Tax=Butyrivibrio sp. DSM 10294 TaxID=2972457 RepID=UPI00234EC962|nr:hypothetical protein [Butyrivibrio sp. DSM 10294]MDC7293587.1 hypothetical protein [Butyrivibrio sp. DSM 10294]